MQQAIEKTSTRAKAYNAFTSLATNLRAIGRPATAARYLYHRDLYRTSTWLENPLGSNQNFRPRPLSADADTKRTMQTIIDR
ncbi:hypothetical protein [Desulfogranum japonicum]|uniref:hypothetical protein n=1 Tax=Desulfogranum japonicum TaxID=231447 RepID=UPI00040A40B8|nr:hypothetical protein [Desulfogranum japonicum]